MAAKQEGGPAVRAKSKQKKEGVRWLRYGATILFLIVVLFGFYYLLYTNSRRELLDDYHLRVLGRAARNLETAVANLQSNVGHAPAGAERDARPAAGEPYEDALERALRSQVDKVNGASFVDLKREADLLREAELQPDDEGKPNKLYPEFEPAEVGTRATLDAAGTEPRLVLVTRFQVKDEGFFRARSEAPLRPLLQDVLPPGFEAVVLSRVDGEVLLQIGGARARLTRLPGPKPVKGKEAPPAEPGAEPGTALRVVVVAGVDHKSYLQPLEVDLAAASDAEQAEGASGDWVLCGLMPVSVFRAQALKISPTVVLTCLGVLMFAVLSLPFLKLRFLGRRAPLKALDVAVLGASSVVLGCLATLAVVDFAVYRRLEAERVERLVAVGDELRASARDEIDQLEQQLDALTAWFDPTGPRTDLLWELEFTGPEDPSAIDADGTEPAAGIDPGFHHPRFEMAFWMGSDGGQLDKRTIRAGNTPPVPVASREYFQRALRGELWDAHGQVGGEGGRYVQSIRSKTTGGVFGVLSKRVAPGRGADYSASVRALAERRAEAAARAATADPGAARTAEAGASVDDPAVASEAAAAVGEAASSEATLPVVAAIQARLGSVIEPVLPPGMGFAVVDTDGTVLFHSSPERNLREQLFEEVRDGETLAARVATRSSDVLRSTYRADSHLFRVLPMSGVPWSLVVFVEREMLRSLHFEVLTFTLLLLSSYLLVLALLAAWSGAAPSSSGRGVIALFWPAESHSRGYRTIALAAAVLIAHWGVVSLYQGALWGAVAGACVGGLALAFGFVVARAGESPGNLPRRPGRLALLAALGAAGFVLPAPYHACAHGLLLLFAFLSRRPRVLFGVLILLLAGWTLMQGDALEPVVAGSTLVTSALLAWLATVPRVVPPVPRAHWRRAYWAAWAGVLATLAVVPAFGFYRAVHDEAVVLFAKRDQTELAAALAERHRSLLDGYATAAVSPGTLELLERELRLVPASWDVEASGSPADADALGAAPDVVTGRGPAGDAAGRWLVARERVGEPPPVRPERRSAQPLMAMLGEVFGLHYNRLTRESRGLVADAVPEAGWSWSEAPDAEGGRRLWFRQQHYRAGTPLGRNPDLTRPPVDLQLGSRIAPLLGEPEGAPYWLLAAGVLAFLYAGVFRNAIARVFLMDTARPVFVRGRSASDESGTVRRLLVYPDPRMLAEIGQLPDRLELDTGELRHESVDALFARAVESGRRTIVLRSLQDGLDDPALAARKLELIQRLDARRDLGVVLISMVDPTYFLQREGSAAETNVVRLQWTRALEGFAKWSGAESAESADQRRRDYARRLREAEPQLEAGILAAIVEECWFDPQLQELGLQLAAQSWEQGEAAQVVEEVLERAEPRYRREWATCSTDEKIVLYHLAREGFANWQMGSTVRRLMRRGLIVEGPHLRLVNESLRRFALRAVRPRTVAEWEVEDGASEWTRLRGPLLLVLAALVAFFFYTQRQSFDEMLGMLAAVTTSIPVLLKIVGMTARGRTSEA